MQCVVHITHTAQGDIQKLDRKVARRILDKFEFFVSTNAPLRFAKKLTDFRYGEYRFRIGDYRVLFDIYKHEHGDIHILVILRIKHRKDIY